MTKSESERGPWVTTDYCQMISISWACLTGYLLTTHLTGNQDEVIYTKKIAINPNFLHAFPTYHSLSKPANHVKLFLFENIWQLFPYNQTLGHIDHHVGGLGGNHQGDRGGHLGHGRQQDLEDKDGDLGLGVRFHSGGDSVKSGATTLPWPTNWVALAHTPPPGAFFSADPFAAARIGFPAD